MIEYDPETCSLEGGYVTKEDAGLFAAHGVMRCLCQIAKRDGWYHSGRIPAEYLDSYDRAGAMLNKNGIKVKEDFWRKEETS